MTSRPIVGQINYQDEFYKAAIFPSDDGTFSVCIMECSKAFENDLVGTHIENFPEDDIYFKMTKKKRLSLEELDDSPSFNLTDKQTLHRFISMEEDASPSLNLTSKHTKNRFEKEPNDTMPLVHFNSDSEKSLCDLPPGWTQKVDESGRTFYMNKYLRVTQWERPMGTSPPDAKLAAVSPSYGATSPMLQIQLPMKTDSLEVPNRDSPRAKRLRKKKLSISSTFSYPELPSHLYPPVNFPGFLKFDKDIGIEFALFKNGFVVTSVQPCSPAFHECLKQGLQLESIYDGNYKPIQATSAPQLKQQLDYAPRPLYIKFTPQRHEAAEQVYAEVPYYTYRHSHNTSAIAKPYHQVHGSQSNQTRSDLRSAKY